jgi:hypothetical protein
VLSEEQYNELEELSAIGWILDQCAVYFGVNKKAFSYAYENSPCEPGTVKYHYDRGTIMTTAKKDLALSRAAEGGNITALQQFDKKQKERDLKKFKEDLLNGHK